jgi:hypothetical protein
MRYTSEFLLLPLTDEAYPVFLPRQVADQVLAVQDVARLCKCVLGEVGRAARLDAGFQLGRLSIRGSR